MKKFLITYRLQFTDGGISAPMTVVRTGDIAGYVARCFINSQQLEAKIIIDSVTAI